MSSMPRTSLSTSDVSSANRINPASSVSSVFLYERLYDKNSFSSFAVPVIISFSLSSSSKAVFVMTATGGVLSVFMFL